MKLNGKQYHLMDNLSALLNNPGFWMQTIIQEKVLELKSLKNTKFSLLKKRKKDNRFKIRSLLLG